MELYYQLKQIDYNTNIAFVEAHEKSEKAGIRAFANKNGLKYRYYLNKDFDCYRMFKCKECKKIINERDIKGFIGFSDSYVKCSEDYCESVYYLNDVYDDEYCPFKVWIPTNCVIIGKELGEYDREPNNWYARKARGDKLLSDKNLIQIIDWMDGKLIIK